MLGGIGVFLFFAISGFLISYSLFQKLENKKYGFKSFFVDRFSRIYSGLLPALLFTAVIAGAIYATNNVYFNYLSEVNSAPSIQTFGVTLSMAHSFPIGIFNSTASAVFGVPFTPPIIAPFGFNAVLWSLVVEWWVYMFFGWLIIGLLGLRVNNQGNTGGKLMFFGVTALLSVILLALAWDYSAFIAVWFVGVLMMCAVSSQAVRSKLSSPRAAKVLAALFAASVASVGYEACVIYTLTHESFSLLFGILISASVFLGILLLNSKNLHWLSSIILKKRIVKYSASIAGFSYTLFLIHYPLILFLNGLNLETDRLLLFIPILLLINEIAYILASFTEKKYKVLGAKIKNSLHITIC